MKFLLAYFTGTYNTKKLVDVCKQNLISMGHIAIEYDVIKKENIDYSDYDCLFILYPIYAFNAPKPIIQFAKNIEKMDRDMSCIIMKQSGEHLFFNNASSLYLSSILKKKRIYVKNEYHYLMPYSFIFRHSDYMAYRMYRVVEGLVPIDIDRFLCGEEVHLKRFFMDRFFALLFRIQWFGGRLNGRFYRVDDKKCIKCLKCISSCPSNNISINDDTFKFSGKCLMCQRCIMYCPTGAIKVGMFNSWRVDKPYGFVETPYQEEVKPKYCKKNYERYFKESEEIIRLHGETKEE